MTQDEIARTILGRMQQSASPYPEVPGIYRVGDQNKRDALLLNLADVSEMQRVPDVLKFQFEAAWCSLLAWGYIATDASVFHAPLRDRPVLTELGKTQDTSQAIPGLSSGDQFVLDIESVSGPLDLVVRQYLSESWESACTRRWLSSAFMLGAASERLINVLAEAVEVKLQVTRSPVNNRTVKALNDWLISQIPGLKNKYPQCSADFHDLDSVLSSVFQNYRITRNTAGHPRSTVVVVDERLQLSNLHAFKPYARIACSVLKLS